MRVLFINDSSSSSNWGDRAAAVSLREMIRARGGHITLAITEDNLWRSWFVTPPQRLDEATVDAGHEPRDIVRQCIPPVVLRARRKVISRFDEGGPERLIPQRWEDYDAMADEACREQRYGWPEVVREMCDTDVVVIHGASLHGNGILQRTDLFLAYLAKVRFGKRVVIANHTVDLEHPDFRRVAEHVYPLFDDVVFRDPISAERWGSICGGRFAADTAFWFKPAAREMWAGLAGRPTYFDVWPDAAPFDPSEPYICVGGSSIFHDRKDWASIVAGYRLLIRHLRSTYDGTILLTASAELDQPVFRALADEFDLPLIGVTTPVQQAVDILGNADAYLGGRWHPGIFALRGGTPLIALSSQTWKMRALAEMSGLASSTFNTLDLGPDAPAIGRQLCSLLEQAGALRGRLRAWGDDMSENCWGNVAYLTKYEREEAAAPGANAC